MVRRWHHEVSAEWLKARQQVLTATDVASLLPEYKRYLKAGSPDAPTPGFAALWCKKHSDVYLDTESTGAAARGHVMEPYAVEAWNMQRGTKFYHWDDVLLIDSTGKLGFSPDAITGCQAGMEGSALASDYLGDTREAMEIKCYEPAQHIKAIMKKRDEHDELMQLAMAFVVLPKLEVARLTWYCPGAPIEMFSQEYTRDDLHDQIRWIMEIAEVYYDKVSPAMEKAVSNGRWMDACFTEDQIYKEHLESMDSNAFLLK